MISDSEIDKVLSHLRDNADRDAQARAERLYLEQWVKTVLAQEQAKHQGSVAAAEVQARISAPYISALEAYKQAIYNDEKAKFMRAAAEAKLEAWRTEQATLRAEGKAYG